MKLKILQINKFHYLRGGSERYYFAVSDLLEKHGHDVVHFSMKGEKDKFSDYDKYFIDYIDLNKFNIKSIIKFFYNYDAVRRLKKLIKKEKPDIAHLHNIAHQLTPAIIRVLKKNDIKVVQTLHDYKLICPNTKLYNKKGNCKKCLGGKYYNCFLNSCMHDSRAKSFLGMIEAYLNNKFLKYYDDVDLFIAPSQFMKNVSVQFGVPEKKIKVVYNFLSDEWLKSIEGIDDMISPKNDNYILYFGRLSEEKGINTVVNAIKESGEGNIKFFIVGAGPDEKKIRNKINDLDLVNHVSLPGFKSGQELNSLIMGASAIVMPSLWPENMPYSLLESLAMSKIIIASNVGGMPELIKNNESGYLYKSGDTRELAKIIAKVSSNSQDTLKNMSKRAKGRADTLDSSTHYNNISDIYKKILNA